MEPWESAHQFVGVPFAHMGRSEKGLDCVGLLVLVAIELGVEVKDSPHYGREPARNNNAFQLADYLRLNFGDPVDRAYRPNDVLMMKLRPRFQPAHVGIVAPHRYGLGIIHAYGQAGEVVYQRIDRHRSESIVEVYQWPAKH
jgi:cell wall-associated NlpC family hydrolase